METTRCSKQCLLGNVGQAGRTLSVNHHIPEGCCRDAAASPGTCKEICIRDEAHRWQDNLIGRVVLQIFDPLSTEGPLKADPSTLWWECDYVDGETFVCDPFEVKHFCRTFQISANFVSPPVRRNEWHLELQCARQWVMFTDKTAGTDRTCRKRGVGFSDWLLSFLSQEIKNHRQKQSGIINRIITSVNITANSKLIFSTT